MQVEYDARAAADHEARAERDDRLVHVLGDDGFRLESAQLPGHTPRQAKVVQRPVERARPRRARQPESFRVRRRAGLRGRHDAVVEELADRIPLAPLRVVER